MSLVLNDRPGVRIAAATRRRVLETARRLGYRDGSSDSRPRGALNAVAYVLGTGRQPLSRMHWHFGALMEMQRCVVDDNRCTIFLSTTDAAAAIAKLMRVIDRTQPLGVALDGHVPEAMIHELEQRKLPFVIMGVTQYAHEPAWIGRVNTLSIDVQEGMRMLMRWLAEHGGSSMAFAYVDPHLLVNRLLLQAYQEAVRELELTYHPALIQVCAGDADGRYLLSRYEELGVQYDSMLVGSLPLARTILASSASKQSDPARRAPLMAVVGTGETSDPAPPGVASVYVRYSDYAQRAYDLLSNQIRHPERKPQNLLIPMSFHDPSAARER